jgi:hypothetical protein
MNAGTKVQTPRGEGEIASRMPDKMYVVKFVTQECGETKIRFVQYSEQELTALKGNGQDERRNAS